MRLLILGGTVFVGRALTEAALEAGHDVTHFRRGTSAPPDPRVTTLRGDRAGDLAALDGREWDAVIDTSGYLPSLVERSARSLAARAGTYLFVSSISVYAGPRFDEGADVLPAVDPEPERMTPEAYGALKAMCEARVRDAFGARALVVRPGLIVGPHDPTDRFTYWPVRIARGGDVLAPGRPGRPVQFIDARDLAQWMVALAGQGAAGTFNATGPAARLTTGRFLEAARAACNEAARLEWVDDAFLVENGVAAWTGLPLWIPEGTMPGFQDVPIDRALAQGLVLRPIESTLADTLAWHRTRDSSRPFKCGLSPEREAALLAAWRARRLSA